MSSGAMGGRAFLPNLLTVGCWNIEGIFEKVNRTKLCKMDEQIFQDTIKHFDILCIQETHTGQNETQLYSLNHKKTITTSILVRLMKLNLLLISNMLSHCRGMKEGGCSKTSKIQGSTN